MALFKGKKLTGFNVYAYYSICHMVIIMCFTDSNEPMVFFVINKIGKTVVCGSCDSSYLMVFYAINILITVIDKKHQLFSDAITAATVFMHSRACTKGCR